MIAQANALLSSADVESALIAVLALLFWHLGHRAREPGLYLLAAGFMLAAGWTHQGESALMLVADLADAAPRAWAIVFGSAMLLVSAGIVRYLGFPRAWLRWLVMACWLPAAVMISALALGRSVPAAGFHAAVLLSCLGAAAVAVWRSRQHPGEAHLPLAVALLALAGLPLALDLLGVPANGLRDPVGLGLVLFGLLVLVTSLQRRQRALTLEVGHRSAVEALLRDANQRLEARVAERTHHLHELIAGLESFNRGISHDLRGPLGSMAQLARLAGDALQREDSAMARRVLPAIATQCDDLVRRADAMLSLARLGEASARRQRVALAGVVDAAFAEVRPAQGPAPQLVRDRLVDVLADPELLHTFFVNLLGNAVKATRPCSAPRIDVEVRHDAASVLIRVRDNGTGFEPGIASRLFEPFFRADGAGAEGHGLGLSIVRRAVEAMGGRVWAEAPAAGGALFCVRLPNASAEAPAIGLQPHCPT